MAAWDIRGIAEPEKADLRAARGLKRAMARAEQVGAYDVNAAREYRAIGERRAKLLGIDAVGPVLDTVAQVDEAAALKELNVALVRLGK